MNVEEFVDKGQLRPLNPRKIGEIDMIVKGDYSCASVSGEIHSDEGYCWLYVWVNFNKSLHHEFGNFLQDYMDKYGVKSKALESYYEVGIPIDSIHNDTLKAKKLLIEFSAADTEYSHFEEYFEGEEFLQFMREAIQKYVTGEVV